MDLINKIDAIVEKMKSQMHTKGIDSLDKIFIAIVKYDTKRKGHVEKFNFEPFLSKLGIFLKSQEVTEIHKYLGTSDNQNMVRFENFIALFKCEIPESLAKIISEAFSHIQEGNGTISVENLRSRIQIGNHPRVKIMKKDSEMVMSEFESSIRFILGEKTSMDENEFIELHKNLFCVSPHEILPFFSQMVPALWGC